MCFNFGGYSSNSENLILKWYPALGFISPGLTLWVRTIFFVPSILEISNTPRNHGLVRDKT